VNTTLAPIVVKVSDCAGRALSGEAVTFGVTTGGGSVTPSKGTGNSQGLVNVMWTLGPIEGPQTMTASVAGVQTNVLTIDATATAPAGGINVTAPTSGTNPDDWYDVYVDSVLVDYVEAGSSVLVIATEGSHTISLGGVANNCTVAAPNPRQVTVTRNATTNVAFQVSCVTNQNPR
jgi:hypothetical protein